MNVLPVLLLLFLQLTANALEGTNQTITASPAASNVPTLPITPSNSNATSTIAGVNATTTATANATITAAAAADTGKGTVIKNLQANFNSTNSTAVIAKQLQVETDKPAKVNGTVDNSTVLARGVTNTDTATVNASSALEAQHEVKSTAATVITKPTNPVHNTSKILADGVSLSDINLNKNNSSNSNKNNTSSNINNTTPPPAVNGSATSNSTISTASTKTTTPKSTTTSTTTTVRPKKPTVTISMDKPLEGEKLDPSATGSVAPHALPVQEMSSSAHRDENEYIVPIVTIMLAVPLAIAVFIIIYRRFRDLWSTRHYRRMDFLVDGMYND